MNPALYHETPNANSDSPFVDLSAALDGVGSGDGFLPGVVEDQRGAEHGGVGPSHA